MTKQLPLIQVSRALVPILVVIFHIFGLMKFYYNDDMPIINEFPISSGGVYYFFVLSGFMIYYVHKIDLGQPQKIKKYLINRFIRIYPLYWLITLAVIPALFLFPSLGSQGNETDIKIILYSIFLIPSREIPIVGVAWSLQYTILFYTFFSLLFFLKDIHQKIAIICWTLLTLIICYKIVNVGNDTINFIFSEFNIMFISGIACAYIITRINFSTLTSATFLFFGLTGFPFMWFFGKHIPLSYPISITICSIFIIFGLSSIDIRNNITTPKIASFLGSASFSIYLTHYLSQKLLYKIIAKYELLEVIGRILSGFIVFFASIAVGCLVYLLIEKPLNKQLKKILLSGAS